MQESTDPEVTDQSEEDHVSEVSTDMAIMQSIRNAVERLESASEGFTNLVVTWKLFQSILLQLKDKVSQKMP